MEGVIPALCLCLCSHLFCHDRKFPLDMAGFAINLRGLLEKPEVQVGLEEDGSPNPLGYLETRLLQKFVTRETVECRGSMTEVRKEGRVVGHYS